MRRKKSITYIVLVGLMYLISSLIFQPSTPQDKAILTVSSLPHQALPKPKKVFENLEDFIYAMDYLAFYQINETIFFSFESDYQNSFYNPYTEFQKAYSQADLADVYACQMDDSLWSEKRVIGLKYSISREIATNPPNQSTSSLVVPSFDYGLPTYPIRTLPLEDNHHKKEISCVTGEQLYWLAMNGYKPKPKEGSSAAVLYQKAKVVLFDIIDQNMNQLEQTKAVYDWLTTEIQYDYETAYSSETYLIKEQAYYLEGVFLHQKAVCDGKSKAYALLLNMLEIPCFRDTGKSENGDHAWNMVEIDGKWYISCTTYGQANLTKELNRIIPNYTPFLAGKDIYDQTSWGYESEKHLVISSQLEEAAYPVYQQLSDYQAGIHLQVTSMEDVKELLYKVSQKHLPEYKIEFEYIGIDEQFEPSLLDYMNTQTNTSLLLLNNEGGKVYQVIYLK